MVAALGVFSTPGSAVVVVVVVFVEPLKVTERLGRFDPDFDLVMVVVVLSEGGEAEGDERVEEEEEGRSDRTEGGRGEEEEGAEESWVAGTLSARLGASFTRAALSSLAYVNVS